MCLHLCYYLTLPHTSVHWPIVCTVQYAKRQAKESERSIKLDEYALVYRIVFYSFALEL